MSDMALQFIDRLAKLAIPEDEDDLLEQVEPLLEIVEKASDPSVVPAIFAFIERVDDQAHLGDPGPLVHYLESSGDLYRQALLESVLRKPTLTTLQMVNRLLNWDQLQTPLRGDLMLALKRVSADDALRPDLRQEARKILARQASRGHVEPELPPHLIPTGKAYTSPGPDFDNLTWTMLEDLIGQPDGSPASLKLSAALGDQPFKPGKLFRSPGNPHYQIYYRAGLEIEYRYKTGVQVLCQLLESDLGDDRQPYRGPLPDGVQYGMSEGDIVALHGKPDSTGGGDFHPIRRMGKRPRWIGYAGSRFSTFFFFNLEDGKLFRVSLKKNDEAA